MNKNNNHHHDCHCENHLHTEHCNCGHDHTELEDDYCDLDDTKICDNCGKCLDIYNTDEKGFVQIGIDKIDSTSGLSLDDLYKMYGLDDEDDEKDTEDK